MEENKNTNVELAENENADEGEVTGFPMSVSSNFTYGFSEQLWMEDVDSRKLFLTDDVDERIFEKINYFILRCNEADKADNIPVEERVPIKIYINSMGGLVWAGLSCIEMIKCSKTPVYAICTGYALSMAFHIFANCHKRFATRSAFFLNHEGADGGVDSPSKLRDYFKFADRLSDRLNEYLVERTNLTMSKLKAEKRVEKYYFADEAKELGIVDTIITSLDEIL